MRNIILLLIVVFFGSSLQATTIDVPGDALTIQDGIALAENGDTVLVSENTYFENINFKGKAITVASHFILDQDTSHISRTIINGSKPSNADSGSVVYFSSGEDTTSILLGFTITGGTGTIAFVGVMGRIGGGININAAGAKISNNYIKNNLVSHNDVALGGGLITGPPGSNGFSIIENNLIESNFCLGTNLSGQGGGLQQSGGNTKILNNIIKNNLVSSTYGEAFGAGLSAVFDLDSVLICDNSILNNKAETYYGMEDMDGALGGGLMIYNDHTSYIRVMNNIFAFNEVFGSNWTAGAGVGLEDVKGDVLFANNIVYENYYDGTVDCHGTGICVFDNTELKIINNTVVGNESSPYGGALSTWKTIATVAANNIFWGNSDGTASPEIAVWNGKAPEITYSDIQGGWDGEGNKDASPLFVNAEIGNFRLLEGSPCIGWGLDSSIVPQTDFYGNIRPDYSADEFVDIGAIESPYRQTPTAFDDINNKIPQEFVLKQNYPNPFNPKTIISYQVPLISEVELSIYNLLGQKITKLVSEKQSAGTYKVEWDATGFASGLYFYRLETDKGFVQSKKLILLK